MYKCCQKNALKILDLILFLIRKHDIKQIKELLEVVEYSIKEQRNSMNEIIYVIRNKDLDYQLMKSFKNKKDAEDYILGCENLEILELELIN